MVTQKEVESGRAVLVAPRPLTVTHMEDAMTAAKQCTKCGALKPLGDFHRLAQSKDGHKSRCKQCNVRAAVEYAQKNHAKTAARIAQWQEQNRQRCRDNHLRWRLANPDKVVASYRSAYQKHPTRSKEYADRNRERVRKIKSAWKSRNQAHGAAWAARRRAAELRAMPAWVDASAVAAIYVEATAKGLTVDHIVPLNSRIVCGLHCPANLRLLPRAENTSKGNRWWPDMPGEDGS